MSDRDPTKSDERVYKYGEQMGLAESREQADKACDAIEKERGGKADWSTFAGRYVVRHLSQKKIDALDILDGLIDGEDDQLAKQLKQVKEALID